jgi:DNA invertase Pin-like site-specific DNA recombinase
MNHAVSPEPEPKGPPVIAAAQYVRMSTDQQRYSIDNQVDAISRYADQRGMTIVRTYEDTGKSGLDLEGRPGLTRFLRDVHDGATPFEVLIVYDISRWGRFQDTDESAYYEFLCKRSGIRIAYCAEPFENDGSPFSAILKSMKRAMAAEYSRELSAKVFVGQSRMAARGFHVGQPPTIGLRRMLLDCDGLPKGIMLPGQRKAFTSDKVILVPGPAKEIALIRKIFRLFVCDNLGQSEICRRLNAGGIPSAKGIAWNEASISQILKNEKYAGVNVYNRSTKRMKRRPVPNPRELWIRKPGAFKPLIERTLFDRARAKFESRAKPLSDAEMLVRLKDLFGRKGTLSRRMIDAELDLPAGRTYAERFQGLVRAYALVGHFPFKNYQSPEFRVQGRRYDREILLSQLRELLRTAGRVSRTLIDLEPNIPPTWVFEREFAGLGNAYALIGYLPAHGFPGRRKLSGALAKNSVGASSAAVLNG